MEDGAPLNCGSSCWLLEFSIWNGNEPRPVDMVDSWDPVDIPPSMRRLGGGSKEDVVGVSG